MNKYKAIISYDGTEYRGWQKQLNRPTVAHVLQRAFSDVFGAPMKIIGVSRTDSGVHARGQVATIKTPFSLDPEALRYAWNNKLPQGVHIRSLISVPPDFNPHAHIDYKEYWYHLFTRRPSPFKARYGWYVRKRLSLEDLQSALQVFVGTHDFRSFSTGDDRGEDTIRTIQALDVVQVKPSVYRIVIRGPKFLRYMIRRVVGAAVTLATRKDVSLEDLRVVLAQKNPRHTLPTAPACGLVLAKIVYTLDQQD